MWQVKRNPKSATLRSTSHCCSYQHFDQEAAGLFLYCKLVRRCLHMTLIATTNARVSARKLLSYLKAKPKLVADEKCELVAVWCETTVKVVCNVENSSTLFFFFKKYYCYYFAWKRWFASSWQRSLPHLTLKNLTRHTDALPCYLGKSDNVITRWGNITPLGQRAKWIRFCIRSMSVFLSFFLFIRTIVSVTNFARLERWQFNNYGDYFGMWAILLFT